MSATPACLHRYKAQLGLLKPVPKATRFLVLPVNFKDAVMSQNSQMIGPLQTLTTPHSQLPVALQWNHSCPGKRSAALDHCLMFYVVSLLFSPIYLFPVQLLGDLQRVEVRPYFLCTLLGNCALFRSEFILSDVHFNAGGPYVHFTIMSC